MPSPRSIDDIQAITHVFFDTNLEYIRVRVEWSGVNPRTGHAWRSSCEPLETFAEDGDMLLDSDAWARFVCSPQYAQYQHQYPEEFDIETILGQQYRPRQRRRLHDDEATEDEGDEGGDDAADEGDLYEDEYEPVSDDERDVPVHVEQPMVMTLWEIACEETFESVRECPVCLTPFADDGNSLVCMLHCKHIICSSCFTRWPKCLYNCKSPSSSSASSSS